MCSCDIVFKGGVDEIFTASIHIRQLPEYASWTPLVLRERPMPCDYSAQVEHTSIAIFIYLPLYSSTKSVERLREKRFCRARPPSTRSPRGWRNIKHTWKTTSGKQGRIYMVWRRLFRYRSTYIRLDNLRLVDWRGQLGLAIASLKNETRYSAPILNWSVSFEETQLCANWW